MITYLKIGGLVAAALALAALLWVVNGWRTAAASLPVVEAERDRARADLTQARVDFDKVQEASSGYQEELNSIRAHAASQSARVVRLCSLPADSKPRPVSPAERGPDESSAAAGGISPSDGLHSEPGRDIGPGLYGLADRADELSAQVRGLQEYARGCAVR